MTTLSTLLDELQIGPARTFGGLTAFPLLTARPTTAERTYRTLDEAIADRTARVTEISEGGSVPELRFVNDGDRPVLLLDGEELAGAKQNRILNLTILCPPKQTIVIPVSCVEAGRWSHVSTFFKPEQHVMYSAARGRKAAQVSAAMASFGRARSDQSAIWDDVADLSRRFRVSSATGEMREVYRQSGKRLDEYVAAFPPAEDQVGAIFALGAEVRGAEVFDHPETLRGLFGKIVRSWALDAMDLEAGAHSLPTPEAARGFLDRVGGVTLREHAAVGLGRDLRLEGHRLTGGALVHEERVVHLCAFAVDEQRETGWSDLRARMVRASRRARGGSAA
jgi:hypothetical protein